MLLLILPDEATEKDSYPLLKYFLKKKMNEQTGAFLQEIADELKGSR